jgi:glutamyl-tRNA synthetase
MPEIKTRFAPSPTGYLHVGGARTALFNWLYARNAHGKFILRIEDTDLQRSTPEATQAILDGMTWLGLDWDEGPFFQSQRLPLYQEYAQQLLKSGHAYKQEEALYFKSALPHEDNFVIMKSDGMPTYHFGVVIDDWQMGVTHVIRGSDHLSNTPKHLMIYDALGVKPPEFTHVPMILGSDGQRLSKRHGATSVLSYREMGFLPDAMINYLARLGWAHGDQEIFTRDELVEKFSLEKVGKSAGIFDIEKLSWLNNQYIQKSDPQRLIQILADDFHWQLPNNETTIQVIKLLQPRAKVIPDMIEHLQYFFTDTLPYDAEAITQNLTPDNQALLAELKARFEALPIWDHTAIETTIKCFCAEKGIKPGAIIHPLRVALTGRTASPGIYETAALIGKERVVERMGGIQVPL